MHPSIAQPLRLTLALAGLLLMAPAHAAGCPAVLDHRVERLQDEKPQDLCQYAGRVVLVVNTASFCGYTPQYKSLEALHARYAARGLTVLGFPSNDFGNQEPGANRQIADFCENTFGVRFPMFVKTRVAPGGTAVHPLYAELARRTGQAPRWNFHKYLIARDGSSVVSHASDVDPAGAAFVRDVERLLSAK
jgi:glutathione peroxidase